MPSSWSVSVRRATPVPSEAITATSAPTVTSVWLSSARSCAARCRGSRGFRTSRRARSRYRHSQARHSPRRQDHDHWPGMKTAPVLAMTRRQARAMRLKGKTLCLSTSRSTFTPRCRLPKACPCQRKLTLRYGPSTSISATGLSTFWTQANLLSQPPESGRRMARQLDSPMANYRRYAGSLMRGPTV